MELLELSSDQHRSELSCVIPQRIALRQRGSGRFERDHRTGPVSHALVLGVVVIDCDRSVPSLGARRVCNTSTSECRSFVAGSEAIVDENGAELGPHRDLAVDLRYLELANATRRDE
jgi:hypothetical protein